MQDELSEDLAALQQATKKRSEELQELNSEQDPTLYLGPAAWKLRPTERPKEEGRRATFGADLVLEMCARQLSNEDERVRAEVKPRVGRAAAPTRRQGKRNRS